MKRSVLLVDDDLNLLAGLRRALRKEDFDVLYSTSAEWALRSLKSAEVDLIISDMRMSGLNGIEFLRAVKESHPDTVRFVLSGHVSEDDLREEIEAGIVDEVFTKPCKSDVLAERIRARLAEREAADSRSTD